MKKKLFYIPGIILCILLIGFFALSLSLDGLVKSAIQKNGSQLLKTEVNVDDVALSLWNGKGTIDGVEIRNPEGFEDRAAIQFNQVSLQVDLSTLFSDTIVVNNLTVQNPSIFVEQNSNGNNLKTLQNQLGSTSGSSSQAHLVISHLLINDGQVQLTSKLGKERKVEGEIAQIELTDVGKKGSGNLKETARQILEPVLQRAITEATKEGLMDVVEEKVQDLLGG
ncbi:hypothetical protein NC796_09440 [Aliifodinibius sp. S!AR15-10]|uniref:DUF748 domain-containing protein n=1 Tax=Aliifodinibius sp. S!AR15-10 TaxID=2950437 RepID=UPI002860B2B9|nr:hypothetical protein [Aliifodinibius sp. S!AR15-10]MDR8391360.1 hypothetical protein [Aliifodinibius sp. S!AR15-10]